MPSTGLTVALIKALGGGDMSEIKDLIDESTFSPAQIQQIVRSGKAREYFSVGDEIIIPYTNYAGSAPVYFDMPFVVVHIGDAYDQDDVKHENALWLTSRYAESEEIPFDASEGVTVDLSSEPTAVEGWHYWGASGTTYTALNLETGATIPTTYDSIMKCKMNSLDIARYGYNRWSMSAYRQWLNSDANKNDNWWTSQHDGDVAPSTTYTNKPGWLRGFTEAWKSVFKPVKVQTACNTVTDGGVTDVTYDKFFLPSLEQMYGNPQAAGVEGDYWEYCKDETGLDAPSNGSNTDTNDARKIPSVATGTSSSVYVRLRSAYRGSSNGTWLVSSAGYLYGGSYAYGAARSQPACVIY